MHAKFTSGPVVHHLIRVTLANSVSLLSLYVVDLLAMYWLSRSQDAHVLAAIGLVSVLQFLVISICLGLSSAMMTLISRYVGAGEPVNARNVATSSLIGMLCLAAMVALVLMMFGSAALSLLGAKDRVLELASGYLHLMAPAFVVMALGQVCVYILLANGQSNLAMLVVLSGTATVAVLDPIFIVYLGWGLDGAAAAYAIARMVALFMGLSFVSRYKLVQLTRLADSLAELRGVIVLAVPTIVSNLAPGVAVAYVFSQFANYGPEILAGATVIDRILQFTFGAFFALPGAIAPVLGQNLGARHYDRVQSTIRWSAVLVIGFGVSASLLLVAFSGLISSTFHLTPAAHDLVMLFCWAGGAAWTLIGLQFVALPTFNVMRKPLFSAAANWGRATIGTVPFVLVGAFYWGAHGVLAGQLIGNAVVSVVVFVLCLIFVRYQIKELRSQI
jgi:putative MATE family efflux protein